MGTKYDNTVDDGDREIRINEMKQRLDQLSGGKLIAWESDAMPPEEREEFWRRVMEIVVTPGKSPDGRDRATSGPLVWSLALFAGRVERGQARARQVPLPNGVCSRSS